MNIKEGNSTKTILVIATGFIIIFIYTQVKWFIYLALSIALLGLISNKISYYIEFVWMKLAKILSYIVPNIILSIVFYLFLFPIAILARFIGGQKNLQLKNNEKSIWIDNDVNFDKSSFEKMW